MAVPQISEMVHKFAASNVANNLQSMGHAVGAQDVIPVTANTPIQKTPEMNEVGAEIVGEDLSHIVSTGIGDLTTGAGKYRVTKSGRFLQMLRSKLLRKGK